MLAIATFRRSVPLLILLVAMLFFFPLAMGSYQATHGPTSTLKEYVTSLLLQALPAVLAALRLGPRLAEALVEALTGPNLSPSPEQTVLMRC